MPRVAITVPGSKSQPYRFKLDREKVSIGRGGDSDIVIDDPSVSGMHCTMERVSGGYILRDRKSTNGISLDGDDMDIIDLRNGDDVKVGDVVFEYTLGDDELDDLDTEDFEPHEKKKVSEQAAPAAAPKRRVVQAAPASPISAPPMLASSSSGSGGLGFVTFILGVLALLAGVNNGYVNDQEEHREGDISLFADIRDGKPAAAKTEDEK
ncbi:FHA domain-containing protein [Akkermansiaceae bacterium]|nr:FHA domain-containing protein [Akkermansiaceae bacterium]